VRTPVGAGGDGPDVARVAAVGVPSAATAVAVAAGGNDLSGVRAVLGRPGAAGLAAAGVARGCRSAGWSAGTSSAGPDGGMRYADGVEVEPVVAGLDQEKDQFVAAVHPVADRFGHGVGLVPDDGVADDPAVVLEGERDPPGQPEQVLGRDVLGPSARERGTEVGVQPGDRAAAFTVGVAEVEPARAIIGQHAAGLVEDRSQDLDVGGRAGLEPVLTAHAVVALAPIRRAGDDAVGRLIGHRGEYRSGISDMQARGWCDFVVHMTTCLSPLWARS